MCDAKILEFRLSGFACFMCFETRFSTGSRLDGSPPLGMGSNKNGTAADKVPLWLRILEPGPHRFHSGWESWILGQYGVPLCLGILEPEYVGSNDDGTPPSEGSIGAGTGPCGANFVSGISCKINDF